MKEETLGATMAIVLLLVVGFICGGIEFKEYAKTPTPTTEAPSTTERTITTEANTTEQVTTEEKTLEMEYMGVFNVTAYCPCEQCCGIWATNRPNGIVYGASGARLKANHSIAVDPTVIPYGTKVVINQIAYVAEDCGGAIKGNRIDIYFENHNEALAFKAGNYDIFKIIKE